MARAAAWGRLNQSEVLQCAIGCSLEFVWRDESAPESSVDVASWLPGRADTRLNKLQLHDLHFSRSPGLHEVADAFIY
jgi:hypothetical protein